MAGNIKRQEHGTIKTVTITLNSLAADTSVLSTAVDVNVDIDWDILMDMEFLVGWQTAPAKGDHLLDVYIMRSIDDINFTQEDTAAGSKNQGSALAGSIHASHATTGLVYYILPDVICPGHDFKVLVHNMDDAALLAAGNTCRIRFYKYQYT